MYLINVKFFVFKFFEALQRSENETSNITKSIYHYHLNFCETKFIIHKHLKNCAPKFNKGGYNHIIVYKIKMYYTTIQCTVFISKKTTFLVKLRFRTSFFKFQVYK